MHATSHPTVSVIIPTYNRASLLKHAIESVLLQTYTDTEILIVDDGSNDETRTVILSYIEDTSHGSDRIRYFYQPNQGKSVALNNGLAEVRGTWVAFLDSDDRWLREKLELQLRAVQRWGQSCQACFTDGRYVNNAQVTMTAFQRAEMRFEGSTGLIQDSSSFLLVEPHGIVIPTLLARTSKLQGVGGFDSNLRVYEDKDFMFRLSHATEFCYVNAPLIEIDRSITRTQGLMKLVEREEFRLSQLQYVYEKWLRLDWLQERHRSAIRSQLSQIHSEWATWHLLNEEYLLAREALSRGVDISSSARLLAKQLLLGLSPQLARRIVLRRAARRASHQLRGDEAGDTISA